MTVPALGDHIEIYRSVQNGVTIYNSNTDKTYTIGDKEAKVLAQLDGRSSLQQLQQACDFYSEEELIRLLEAFAGLGFFTRQKRRLNPFKLKLRLWNPNRVFQKDAGVTRLLTAAFLVLCPLLFVGGMAGSLLGKLLTPEGQRAAGSAFQILQSLRAQDYVLLLVGFFLSLFLHETAHAVTARRYDVNVPEIGVMLYCFIPCAYTNVSGIHLLDNSRQKIKVLLSGTLVNLGIIGIFQILSLLLPAAAASPVVPGLIFLNAMTIFMNTMVFLKFDGYYILEVMTDTPQLKEMSLAYLRLLAARKGATRETAPATGPADRILFFAFGLASVVFVPFIVLNALIPLIQFFMR